MKKIGVVGISGGWSSERLRKVIEERTGKGILIEMDHVHFDSERRTLFYKGMDLSELDALIIKKIGPEYSPDYLDRLEVLRYLKQKRGVRIFSDPEKIIRILDRLSCTMTLQANDIPLPPTVITEDIDTALTTVERFGKVVLKPLYSTKAKGMRLLTKDDDVKNEIEEFRKEGNSVLYIQKVIDIPEKDFGLVFIGGEYFATYARVKSDGSWNTCINSGGKYQKYEPSEEMIQLARNAQSIFGLDFTCVDIAATDEGMFVFEVSAFGGFRGLKDAYGMDAATIYLDHVIKELDKDE